MTDLYHGIALCSVSLVGQAAPVWTPLLWALYPPLALATLFINLLILSRAGGSLSLSDLMPTFSPNPGIVSLTYTILAFGFLFVTAAFYLAPDASMQTFLAELPDASDASLLLKYTVAPGFRFAAVACFVLQVRDAIYIWSACPFNSALS